MRIRRRERGRRCALPRRSPLKLDTLRPSDDSEDAFIEKFGRETGPDDPVFFDPDADEPRELDTERY